MLFRMIFFLSKNVLLQNQFVPELEGESLEKIREFSDKLNIIISAAEIEQIERLTRAQSRCDLWRWVRIGRITGSILNECSRASITTVPAKMTLLKRICYPETTTIQNEAMAYGRNNEPRALKAFQKMIVEYHKNVMFLECGVIIYRDQPFMSSTPDLIMMCDCCGTSTVEVKCPFRLSGKSSLNNQLKIKNLIESNHPFLAIRDGEYLMVKSHDYYAQIQAEIFVSGSNFGWFFVWSKDEELCLRIERDIDFWKEACEKSLKYFKNIISPELVANYFLNGSKLK